MAPPSLSEAPPSGVGGCMHVLELGPCFDLGPAARALASGSGLCWLDGAVGHPGGRWSFLAADPVERVSVPWPARDPLAAFDRLEVATDVEAPGGASGLVPDQVPRWVGYVAYDAFHSGRAVRLPRPDGRPVLSFARYDAVLALDHRSGRAYIAGDDERSCLRLRERLGAGASRTPGLPRFGAIAVTPAEQHRAAIERALRHIAAGDIYQVNLARCWSADWEGAALPLWTGLRAASPVPFGFYFEDETEGAGAAPRVVMARTMERFLHWQRDRGVLVTRPIKGTLARAGGRDDEEAQHLRADPKECAEHAMIVDLMRNDLGRVATIGTVGVAEAMAIEPYAALSHMVSTIACRTRPDVGLRAVLEATFPPGSVTGAPKLRAIDIIEHLEDVARDAYTGAVGFVDRAGGLSFAVAIRTALLDRGRLQYFAGGGIVEASDPDREVAETDLKARVFLDALHSRAVLG